jgi:hypothetical protein
VLSPSDTSYRSLHPSPSIRELDEGYTPTVFELRFAEERTRTPASCLGLLTMLKTFQCLGYFVKVADVPNSVIRCIAKAAGFEELPDLSGRAQDRHRSSQRLGSHAERHTLRHWKFNRLIEH